MVPAGVSAAPSSVDGAAGGRGADNTGGTPANGGLGSRVGATLALTARQMVTVSVGGADANTGGTGGWPGGGAGGAQTAPIGGGNGGGGGGFTSVAVDGATDLVGGGGGGGGGYGVPISSVCGGAGGAGGVAGAAGDSTLGGEFGGGGGGQPGGSSGAGAGGPRGGGPETANCGAIGVPGTIGDDGSGSSGGAGGGGHGSTGGGGGGGYFWRWRSWSACPDVRFGRRGRRWRLELRGARAVGHVPDRCSVGRTGRRPCNTPTRSRPPRSYRAAAGQRLDVAAANGVLSAAASPAGDPLLAGAVSEPVHGTLALNPDGSFAYTPAAGYAGADSFGYAATDSAGDYATATVSLTVAAAGAPTITITTPSKNASYGRGQLVRSSFTCTDGTAGPGLSSCTDQNGHQSGAALDTATVGPHTLTVTASSLDGQTSTASITYAVARPPVATASPAITGAAKAGATLTCSRGSWSNDPTAYSYQ